MNLNGIIYNDVNESFGMGGPYIGKLDFKGKLMPGHYVADVEKVSNDKSKIVFSKYLGIHRHGFLNLKTTKVFKILVYDELNKCFYQSKPSYQALAIECMEHNTITFHTAFHTKIDSFKKTISFDEKNFDKVEF